MNSSILKLMFGLAIIGASITSCNKEDSCYDEELFQQYTVIDCTTDCPGVTGCDGKTYCNECMANSQGIRVED